MLEAPTILLFFVSQDIILPDRAIHDILGFVRHVLDHITSRSALYLPGNQVLAVSADGKVEGVPVGGHEEGLHKADLRIEAWTSSLPRHLSGLGGRVRRPSGFGPGERCSIPDCAMVFSSRRCSALRWGYQLDPGRKWTTAAGGTGLFRRCDWIRFVGMDGLDERGAVSSACADLYLQFVLLGRLSTGEPEVHSGEIRARGSLLPI